MKHLSTYERFISEAVAKVSDLQPDEIPMITGIADILRQVKDVENRKEIAEDQIRQFKQQGIDFDYVEFIKMCNL